MKLVLGDAKRLNERRKSINNKEVEAVLKKLDTLAILGEDACYRSEYYHYIDVDRFNNACKEWHGLRSAICPIRVSSVTDSILATRLANTQRQLINRCREVLTLYAELLLHEGGKVLSVTEIEKKGYDTIEGSSLLLVERYDREGGVESVIVPERYFDKVRVGSRLTPNGRSLNSAFDLAEYWYLVTIHRLEKESITLELLREV